MPPRKKTTAPAKPKAKPTAKPKAAPKAKTAAKKPAATKSKSKIPFRSLSPDIPETSAKRRKISPAEIPEWDKNVTSQSQRIKATYKLTRASLYDESINERSIDELYRSLDPNSLSKVTWGVPLDSAIKATTGKKAKTLLQKPKNNDARNIEQRYLAMMEDMKGPPREIILNDPKRSHFLRVSLEIRERIYAHLLKYPRSIMVKRDWKTVEANPIINHSIRRVCKQLNIEATSYLFKVNIIQAILRKSTRASAYYDDRAMIPERFVSYYQNVVLDFNSECWTYEWYEKATESLKVLIAAKPALKSLTLIVAPKRVGMSTTALGIESNPVTFADLLWYDGEFMEALRELAPRNLKVIIKKGPTKKLTMAVDLKYLNASSPHEPRLVNPVTWEMLLMKERVLSCEIKELKNRFEEVFEDDEWAVQLGKRTTNEPVVELLPPPSPVIEEVPEASEDAVVEERIFEDDPEDICTNFGGDSDESDEEVEAVESDESEEDGDEDD